MRSSRKIVKAIRKIKGEGKLNLHRSLSSHGNIRPSFVFISLGTHTSPRKKFSYQKANFDDETASN